MSERCFACGQLVGGAALSVSDVAQRLGLTPARVRKLDAELLPTRTETGARVYDAARVDTYARTRVTSDTPKFGDFLTVSQVALLLEISEQRVRDMDARLAPARDARNRRVYARDVVMAELARRGKL